MKTCLIAVLLLCVGAGAQEQQKYPWQRNDTPCDADMTFCWYGADIVSDPQVTAFGDRWVAQDKDEKPFEWITEVRCLKDHKLCILARNQKLVIGDRRMTNIDLYRIESWTTVEIRAVGENDLPKGKECEIDTLILNRVEGSVSMLSTPGPAAATKACMGIIKKPKTVMYRLEKHG